MPTLPDSDIPTTCPEHGETLQLVERGDNWAHSLCPEDGCNFDFRISRGGGSGGP